jgi:hypothetical protein
LAFSNFTGLGGNESIFFNLLSGGTYFLRITGVDNADSIVLDTQFYGILLSFSPVPEPTTLAMVGIAMISAGAWRRVRRSRRI